MNIEAMVRLNHEQQQAVNSNGNVVVTACPGSGKTRVLTARVIRGLSEIETNRSRVVALTFTNRAADEIKTRIDQENISAECLWAGTIHSFALEWILRPYAPYCEQIRSGFMVADEFYSERLLSKIKNQLGLPDFTEINTAFSRSGDGLNLDSNCHLVFQKYKDTLRDEKLLDYDDILFLAYKLLATNPEIASTLGSIIRLVCVDEVQDIQDLQFGILSKIYLGSDAVPSLFFVGDADQSIYESLGALTKNPEEIAAEFKLSEITHRQLAGNYRSSQRIINFYRDFRPEVPAIRSLAKYAKDVGAITFQNQTVDKDEIPAVISGLVSASLESGVPPNDICILAPHWWHVRSVARRLVALLPTVEFDAPGLSPLYSSRDNFWYKVARLFLTDPIPSRVRTRARWANEVIYDLDMVANVSVPESVNSSRRLLRKINSITSPETEGIAYLKDVFSRLISEVGLDLYSCDYLGQSFQSFFEKAEARITNSDGGIPTDIASFRRLFSHPSGVVVSTCHGVKGEEYDTVIAFGLLKGYIPHWSVIIDGTDQEALERESKLLYVICSRAKRHLHLLAESGRQTQSGNSYETSMLLRDTGFDFDNP